MLIFITEPSLKIFIIIFITVKKKGRGVLKSPSELIELGSEHQ